MIALFSPPLTERSRRGAAPVPTSAGALALHPQAARRPERDLLVGLAPSGEGACVVRVSTGAASRPHLRALWAHYDALDRWTAAVATPARALLDDGDGRAVIAEAFQDGPSFESEAARALDRADVVGAARVLGEYRDLLERAGAPEDGERADAFAAALPGSGAWCKAGRTRWLPACALDLMPHNLLRTATGPCAIDLEWAFDAAVPVEFVAARALLVLARREGGLLASNWREAGVPILDLGAGVRLPRALCHALVEDEAALGRWLALVRRHEAALQREAAWQAPWTREAEGAGAPVTLVPPSSPYPLELYGWRVLRDRVRRDHEEKARLEAENARLRRDLAFTAVGLLRRALDRLPWLGGPVRAAYRAVFASRNG